MYCIRGRGNNLYKRIIYLHSQKYFILTSQLILRGKLYISFANYWRLLEIMKCLYHYHNYEKLNAREYKKRLY